MILIYGFEKDDFNSDANFHNGNNWYNIELNDSNNILNESDDESSSEESEKIFNVDEFKPKLKKKFKIKEKRNYKEII